jgi:excinuclease ABC subunit A
VSPRPDPAGDTLRVRGARTHNLQGLDLDLPRRALVVITGPSGSGKSSLAFDTIYAEGQRRYVESLSLYARQFLNLLPRPPVESIAGLSPALAIGRRAPTHNPRSTVGTVTDLYEYLKLYFARAGVPHCPEHGEPMRAESIESMIARTLAAAEGGRVAVLAPLALEGRGPRGRAAPLEALRREGYLRALLDGREVELDDLPRPLPAFRTLEVVVDRLRAQGDERARLREALEHALALNPERVHVRGLDRPDLAFVFHRRATCPLCGLAAPELEPRHLSFNNPEGACPSCAGLGTEDYFDPDKIVPEPARSLAEGAIRGWLPGRGRHGAALAAFAARHAIPLEMPFAALAPETRTLLLEGPPSVGPEGFLGVLPTLALRWQETTSARVREGLRALRSSRVCHACGGSRLNPLARHVRLGAWTLPELVALPLTRLAERLDAYVPDDPVAAAWTAPLRAALNQRLGFLLEVGLGYLTLERTAQSLSGGETQRLHLAGQIGQGLVGVTYVLDEPSVGLHPRDLEPLLGILRRLADLGNAVLVVEHDATVIAAADHVVELGPGGGRDGGRLVAQGSPDELRRRADSPTGAYLAGRARPPRRSARRAPGRARLGLEDVHLHNLHGLSVEIPLGLLVAVTGVSGSGKSTLVEDVLYPLLRHRLQGSESPPLRPLPRLEGAEHLGRVIAVDQQPIGRNARSTPATYSGLFTPLRELFADLPEARARGLGAARFSFNRPGGRCETCQGEGVRRVAMHFLPDAEVVCDRCGGRRYAEDILEIRYRGRSIADVLALTVSEARAFFAPLPALHHPLAVLEELGLGYIALGQSATTLSAGEAQRLKLAREIARPERPATLYLFDEPTTGLHATDVERLLAVFQRLCDEGHSVVVVEHHPEVVRAADWVIDLGPEGGEGGGRVVGAGPPERLAGLPTPTGRWLARLLAEDGARAGGGLPGSETA